LAAVAAGPIATALAPVAVLSARVEFVWKYLMPAPFASVLRVLRLELTAETPVDREVTALALALIPLDAEVEREITPVDSEATPLALALMPLEADDESDPTRLFVLESPVERELTPLAFAPMPDEAEVDRELTLLLVVDRPLEADDDRDDIPLRAVLMPDEAEVDSDPT